SARRETDTMDTFVDSSWYYMRYCSPAAQSMVDPRNDYWMPMDQYIGGIEHAVLHLLYARFWTKVMRDVGLVRFDEPFTRLLCQGMVLNQIYQRRTDKGGVDYFWPEDVENVFGEGGRITGARLKSDGSMVEYAGVGTMSKSKNNGVDPQALIDRYGADTARLFVMFASPPEQTLEWSDAGVEGASRFLRRLWAFCHARQDVLRHDEDGEDAGTQPPAALHDLRFEIHSILRQSTYDYERKQYNTVVSGAMKMLNALDAAATRSTPADGRMAAADAAVLRECMSILLRSLYPVVPHIAHALWQELGFGSRDDQSTGIIDAPWPQVDEQALVRETQNLVLQVNGKVRGSLQLPADAERSLIEERAAASPEVLRLAEGRAPRRIVIVPGRLVNVVV
ncbi:MAG TPA: class I tRNA ligase family protein, partial [Lautropia sp.]|nr:class I tRNA ligase family protein [Lautropia sp.]